MHRQPSNSNDPPRARGGLSLSSEDVTRLLTDFSPETLMHMTGKIAGAYDTRNFDPKELIIAEQIFRLLMRDAEVKVRVTLADRLKQSGSIPRDIVRGLAKDVEEVALPVLRFSEVLTDEDLIEIVETSRAMAKHLAISDRGRVSAAVSDALVQTGQAEVVSHLIKNGSAALSEAALHQIVAQFPDEQSILTSLVERRHLPLAVAEKLITKVSASLAETLQRKYDLATSALARETDHSREDATLHLAGLPVPDAEVEKLVNQLLAFGRLSPSIILNALCQGNFRFFEISLAKLAHIPPENARALICDRGNGFNALYSKSGLPEGMLPAVKLLLDATREAIESGQHPGSLNYTNQVVERILQAAENKEIENLSYLLALVRRGPQHDASAA